MPKSAARAARERPAFHCVECGLTVPKWLGRCPECQAWGSIDEAGPPVLRCVAPGPVSAPALPLDEVTALAAHAQPTGIDEFDRVLGGGLVPGAVLLLAGEPGVGKSTLLLTVAARVGRPGAPTLVVTGEESAAQVRLRAGRVGAVSPHVLLAAETDLAAVLGHVEAVRPGLLVVDSVQTIGSPDVDGTPGGVTQVRAVAAALIQLAKRQGITTLLVGHVTKDGSIAGPRLLEHLVDVVLHLEGDRGSALRLVRAVKNRYGSTDEIGCFELGEGGVTELPDPSGLFLSRHVRPVPGSCVTVSLEGRRPLVAEVQSLVAPTSAPAPRRAVSGLDSGRVAMVLAVLARRQDLPLANREVYAATVGGVRVPDPAADLAIAMAVASAVVDQPLPPGLVGLGEVGLAGEVRPVSGLARRLAEAARLGFTRAVVPRGCEFETPPEMRVIPVDTVRDALDAVRPRRLAPVDRR